MLLKILGAAAILCAAGAVAIYEKSDVYRQTLKENGPSMLEPMYDAKKRKRRKISRRPSEPRSRRS